VPAPQAEVRYSTWLPREREQCNHISGLLGQSAISFYSLLTSSLWGHPHGANILAVTSWLASCAVSNRMRSSHAVLHALVQCAVSPAPIFCLGIRQWRPSSSPFPHAKGSSRLQTCRVCTSWLCSAAAVYNKQCCMNRQHLACKTSKQRHQTPACKAGHLLCCAQPCSRDSKGPALSRFIGPPRTPKCDPQIHCLHFCRAHTATCLLNTNTAMKFITELQCPAYPHNSPTNPPRISSAATHSDRKQLQHTAAPLQHSDA
jgi:hypothetical protein